MAVRTQLRQKPQNATTIQARQGGQTVLTRLQGLLPAAPTSTSTLHRKNMPRSTPSERELPPLPGGKSVAHTKPKALKVRVLTWNMHDSLPKGDLEELLGKVPLWVPCSSSAAGSIPTLPVEAAHPYHFVVIAGQECPTSSGIPMGLGAGFKLIDKDKDKDKEKDRDKEKDKPWDKDRERQRDREDVSRRKNPEDSSHDIAAGWTSMVEDWLCNGSGARINPPTVADVGSPKPLSPRLLSAREPRKGPYALLTKERMMGIYMAIYIHRDMLPLVRGTSKSAVTAGLIGGRVGNKGGVGITVNLDGITFLFLNAHLAAHEGKIHHRLANLAKIKAELSVDDFLTPDDNRVMAEDLTDKFDFTFLCGDLNFRLDITRLHADWLVSCKEYAQALAFDQLKNLMANGQAFVGFREGTIDFPPTFKYDVLRTVSLTRRHRRHGSNRKHLEEKAHRVGSPDEKEAPEAIETEDVEEEAEGEAASMASTFATSVQSRGGIDREIDDDYFHASPSSQMMTTSNSKPSAVEKAKAKFLSLISPLPAAIASQTKLLRSKSRMMPTPHSSADVASDIAATNLLPPGRSTSFEALDKNHLLPPPMVFVSSTKSSLPSDDEDDGRGVYDSSHKKRVPSWCDRILWKSTVVPDPEPEEEVLESLARPRNRFGQFFANAFRPRPLLRRDSDSTFATTTTTTSSLSEDSTVPQDILHDASPIARAVEPPTPRDKQSYLRSIQHLSANAGPPTSSKRNTVDNGVRRSNSATSSRIPPRVLDKPIRRATASAGLLAGSSTATSAAAPPSLWRFLPNLFSLAPATSPIESSTEEPPKPVTQRKGDVICLSYHTLDDRGMRKLEGRSDHRPVIGSYAVYV